MSYFCCNPFGIPGHSWNSRKKKLRSVSAWMCGRAPQITTGSKICNTCRKKLSKDQPVLIPELDSSSSEADEAEVFVQTPEAVSSLNMCLVDIGETPYSQSKDRARNCFRQKVKKITEAIKCTVISEEVTDDGSEIIQQLKEKFQSTTQRSEKLQILTILPESWPLKKTQQEFGVSNYMA